MPNSTPSFKVICIDDSNRPSEIPDILWVRKNRIYTVTDVIRLQIGTSPLGFKIAEIPLPASCYPYEFFAPRRFAVILPKDEAAFMEAFEQGNLKLAEELCQEKEQLSI